MKKFILAIIFFVSFFSIVNQTNAKWGVFEELLNTQYWVETFEINDIQIDEFYFNEPIIWQIYNKIITYNNQTKNVLIASYKAWKFKQREISNITKTYKSFIYNVNQFLYFLNMIDKNPYYKDNEEIKVSLLKAYKNLRNQLKKLNYYVNKYK